MIADFDDFCLWMYVLIDEFWSQLAPHYRRPGPEPACSDSELLTMLLVGECCGWDRETELVSHWQAHRDLFPVIPERSRLNRRRRNLMYALNDLRRIVLTLLDLAQDRQTVIDSLPVPVMTFPRVPSSPAMGAWQAAGAAFGKVPTKHQTIFGYKLHLLVTLNGLILDFILAPANVSDLTVGAEVLAAHHDLVTLGDKAYISAAVAAELAAEAGIALLTVPRRNQQAHLPAELAAIHHHFRQIIETVNGQLTDQFHLETNHAHGFWGLCARLYSKLTAHTLCFYLNRLLGTPDWLQIKELAFH
jgi:DDE family transposase